MDVLTKRCGGCNSILKQRETCPTCADRKRAEMHAAGIANSERGGMVYANSGGIWVGVAGEITAGKPVFHGPPDRLLMLPIGIEPVEAAARPWLRRLEPIVQRPGRADNPVPISRCVVRPRW